MRMIPADDLQLTGISIQGQELTFSLVQPLQQIHDYSSTSCDCFPVNSTSLICYYDLQESIYNVTVWSVTCIQPEVSISIHSLLLTINLTGKHY